MEVLKRKEHNQVVSLETYVMKLQATILLEYLCFNASTIKYFAAVLHVFLCVCVCVCGHYFVRV